MRFLSKLRKIPVIKQVFKSLTKGTGETQMAYDAFTTSVLLKCYEWHLRNVECSRISAQSISEIESELKDRDYFDDIDYIQNAINDQLIKLFSGIDNEEQLNFTLELKASKIPDAGLGVFIKKGKLTPPDTPVITPGTVVAIYPGIVHLADLFALGSIPDAITHSNGSPQITSASITKRLSRMFQTKDSYIAEHLLPDPNFKLLMRLDGVFIDGRGVKVQENSPKFEPTIDLNVHPNSFSLAHMINHPSSPSRTLNPPVYSSSVATRKQNIQTPNVIQMWFDFEENSEPSSQIFAMKTSNLNEFPTKLRKYIPNRYATAPIMKHILKRSTFMHSSVAIASDYLYDGDELLIDYRLGPVDINPHLPKWYSHIDEQAARARLSGLVPMKSSGETMHNVK